jgi:hypothetical protein
MSFGRLQPRNVLHHAAVGDDRRGRQVNRPVSGEEGDNARDLFRSRHSNQRNRRIQFGKQRGVLHCEEVNRRSDRARGNADDQDIVRSEFHTGLADTAIATGNDCNFFWTVMWTSFAGCYRGYCERILVTSSIAHFAEVGVDSSKFGVGGFGLSFQLTRASTLRFRI